MQAPIDQVVAENGPFDLLTSQQERVVVAVVNRLGPVLAAILERLERLEGRLALNVVKETYTVEEAAKRVSKTEWTVRQWCNKGQVEGARKVHGRGRKGEWRITHEGLVRLQNEGPLPLQHAS